MKFELTTRDGNILILVQILREAIDEIERNDKKNEKLPYFRKVNGSYSFNWTLNE